MSNTDTTGGTTTVDPDALKQFVEKWNEQHKSAENGVCPNCGYCPHCGRRNTQPYPYYYQPYWPQPSWIYVTSRTAAQSGGQSGGINTTMTGWDSPNLTLTST